MSPSFWEPVTHKATIESVPHANKLSCPRASEDPMASPLRSPGGVSRLLQSKLYPLSLTCVHVSPLPLSDHVPSLESICKTSAVGMLCYGQPGTQETVPVMPPDVLVLISRVSILRRREAFPFKTQGLGGLHTVSGAVKPEPGRCARLHT